MYRKWNRGISFLIAVLLSSMQAAGCGTYTAYAKEIEYEGVTQFGTSEIYPTMDTRAVSLIVDEVYVAAGDYLEQGAKVLKLTEDSYQSALDHYTAAILRAQNSLTNTQLEYDQAVQEAEYTYEIAAAKADQAEFVREQQIKELEDTIAEHEEVMSELEEAIDEYETGIADGSYSTASGNSSSGGGSSMSGAAKSSQQTPSAEQESESESEFKLPEDGMMGNQNQSESGSETESEGQSESGSETESEGQSENSSETESEGQSENSSETESEGQSESSSETESGDQSENDGEQGDKDQSDGSMDPTQKDELADQITAAEKKEAAQKAVLTTLEKQLQEKDRQYNEILKAIYQAAGIDVEEFCGAGTCFSETEISAALIANMAVKTSSAEEENEVLPQETKVETEVQIQAATEAQTQAATEVQATEVQTQEVTEAQTQEVTEAQTQEVTEAQTQEVTEAQTQEVTEAQTQAEPETQTQTATEAQTQSNAKEQTNAETQPQTKAEGQTDTAQTEGTGTEQQSEKTLEDWISELASMEKERAELYKNWKQAKTELEKTQTELEQLKQSESEQQPEGTVPPESEQQPEGTVPPESEQQPNGTVPPESEQQPEGTVPPESEQQPNGTVPPENEQQSESNGESEGQNGMTGMNGNSGMTGSFPSMSGGSAGSANAAAGLTGMSGFAQGTSSGSAVSGTVMQMGMNGQMQSADSDISLFGDEYDLTEVKNLLEQEVSSEDQAEELLEKLEQWQETVKNQYAELTREEEATRLDIQYTYDCSVIEGKQAEITYQEEIASQDETLQEAKDALADLQDEKALLENLEDRILTAEQAGYVAAVNYEAEDELNAATALYSIYNMETATVALSVPQEEISLFSVGDAVEVQISGMRDQQGTVSSKAADSTGEGSRTEVNYEVEVSIENTGGRLSAQSAAVITIEGESEEILEDE